MYIYSFIVIAIILLMIVSTITNREEDATSKIIAVFICLLMLGFTVIATASFK